MYKHVSKSVLGAALAMGMLGAAHAAVDTYVIDPTHIPVFRGRPHGWIVAVAWPV